MPNELQSIPARFTPGTVLEGRLSSAIVLDVHEVSSLAVLLLLPSGYRVITKLWQIEAWNPAAQLTEGWKLERLADDREDPDWSVYLQDIESITAVLNDHRWHAGEPAYRYRVAPPDSATDDEMSHIEEIGGIL
jgi:hypothetical protein